GRGGGGTSEGTVGKGDGTIGRGGGGGTGSGYGTGANVQNSRRRSAPKVRSGKATSNNPDALPVEVARRFVRRHINELKYCYQQELKSKPDLQGRVELSFTVDTRGIVVKATAKAPAELDRLGKCMSAAARRWKFPKSKAKVTFTFPFVFSKS
ncbi:MAG: AgmX/PglI C-terminal domain-containing protein, partial [Deltaproteobacteria bacterium]|nr:AgmX/PglI C-terminal domain-containing protein [Deltaproteobacteria bacterium]